MNEVLRKWLEITSNFLSRLSKPKKILLGALGTLLVIGTVIGTVALKQDPYHVLYSELMPEESKAVVKKLSELNIPHQLSEDMSLVLVPTSQVATARMQLAKEGIPGQDVVGFEKFDASTLGMSSYVQRIQYVRAVQGELTRSIQRLASVKRARVHISLPSKKTFLEEQEAPKASVILELKQSQTLSKAEVGGVAHLVASAVEGLSVKQVTIVDTKGNFHYRPEDGAGGVSNTLIEAQRTLENEYERRVEDLLVPVVGVGKVNAKVTVEIDPSQSNSTEESYDPERAVARNVVKNDEMSQGSRPNPLGIPGSRSNLPGSEVQNPPVPMASQTTEKNAQNTNYAIPRKIQVVSKPAGSIRRLTVSVVVDGHYTKGDVKTGETFVPRSEEELKRLQEIVANAVGYDPQRRDSITVSCLPFKTTDIAPLAETTDFQWQDFVKHALRNALLLAVILLFFFLVLRPFLSWATTSDIQQAIALLPKTVAELEAARQDPGMLALTKAAYAFEEGEPFEKKEESELHKRVDERLANSPKKGVKIVQEWLEEDMPPPKPKAPE